MIKLKTEILRNMLNKAIKVCSFNDKLPLTSLVEIETNENGLLIKTTDNITTMIVMEPLKDLTPARVTIDANIITALINKITTDEVELIITESALTVVGNGVYNLDIRVDESGEIIKLPSIDQELINSANKEFAFKEIVEKLKICRSAIPDNMDQIELNNYYMKDLIIATNVLKLSAVKNVESMSNEELFIPADLGKILMELDFAKANYAKVEDNFVIVGENFVIGTTLYGEFDKYPLEAITNIINQKYLYSVSINKKDLSSLLDRLSLFVTKYDSNTVDFIFTPENLKITNNSRTCDEDVEYKTKEVDGLVEFPCTINIEYFKAQLEALPDENITFKFGGILTGLAMEYGDMIQVAAIFNED